MCVCVCLPVHASAHKPACVLVCNLCMAWTFALCVTRAPAKHAQPHMCAQACGCSAAPPVQGTSVVDDVNIVVRPPKPLRVNQVGVHAFSWRVRVHMCVHVHVHVHASPLICTGVGAGVGGWECQAWDSAGVAGVNFSGGRIQQARLLRQGGSLVILPLVVWQGQGRGQCPQCPQCQCPQGQGQGQGQGQRQGQGQGQGQCPQCPQCPQCVCSWRRCAQAVTSAHSAHSVFVAGGGVLRLSPVPTVPTVTVTSAHSAHSVFVARGGVLRLSPVPTVPTVCL